MGLQPVRDAMRNLIFGQCANIWTFLVLYCLCYLIETITFTYLVTTVQSIERQFQIPSRVSGTLAASGDIGYVLTVIFLAYFGSKGNRARWIGAGCILISFACFLIALPHFLFQHNVKPANESVLFSKIDIFDLIDYKDKFMDTPPPTRAPKKLIPPLITTTRAPAHVQQILSEVNASTDFVSSNMSLKRMKRDDDAMLLIPEDKRLRMSRASSLPMAYCNPLINKMRKTLQELRCKSEKTNNIALTIVFIGIMLIGVGHSMPWSLGMPFIDDHVKRKNTPLYFGGVFFIRIIGPGLGFLIGSACVRMYVTLQNPPGMTPLDPRWIGAWWLGFVIVSAALIVPSILLFFFPHIESRRQSAATATANGTIVVVEKNGKEKSEKKNLKNGHGKTRCCEEKEKTKDEALLMKPRLSTQISQQTQLAVKSVGSELQAFFVSAFLILQCPVYVSGLAGRLFDAFSWKGFFVFLPKYLDNHYGIPQHKAAVIIGGLGVGGFAIGSLIGSVVMKKCKLEGRRAALFVGVCSLLSAVLAISKIALGCTSIINQAGLLASQSNYTSKGLENKCNADCACTIDGVYPVCSEVGTMYYSPCYAGCRNMTLVSKANLLFNITQCYCIDEGYEVSRENCKHDCDTPLAMYFVLDLVGGIIGGIGVIPSILILLRSVPHNLRSLGLGISAFTVSLLSTFPSPIVYGFIVDTACIKWTNHCGGQGACEIYDPVKLRYRTHLFMSGLRALALIFDVLVWYYAKDLKLMEHIAVPQKDELELKHDGKAANGKNVSFSGDEENEEDEETIAIKGVVEAPPGSTIQL